MPSQIKVDEIKNVAGQYKIKTDTLEGQANTATNAKLHTDSTVESEGGAATTKVSQGLAKQWVLQKQKTSHQTMDSFNTSSVDDHATAVIEPKFTNNMASDNYIITGGVASGTYNGVIMMPSSTGGDDGWTVATTGYYIAGRGNGSNYTLYADIERIPVAVHGDLA